MRLLPGPPEQIDFTFAQPVALQIAVQSKQTMGQLATLGCLRP